MILENVGKLFRSSWSDREFEVIKYPWTSWSSLVRVFRGQIVPYVLDCLPPCSLRILSGWGLVLGLLANVVDKIALHPAISIASN